MRTVLCVVMFTADVALRLSPLPLRESLTPHTISTLVVASLSIVVGWLSVLLVRWSSIGRALSVCVAALAVVSTVAQIAKIYFAYGGHRSLRFVDHVSVTPHSDLVYFNVPLILTYTADILLWLVALVLSMVSTSVLKRRLVS